MKRVASKLVLIIGFCLLPIQSLAAVTPTPSIPALSESDLHAINYDTNFYEEGSGACSTGDIPSTTDLDKSTIDAINKLKPFFVQAATATGVPWQMLAAVSFRENGANPNEDMQAGNPIGGPYTQDSSAYKTYGYPKTFEESVEIAAKQLIAMSSSGVVKKPINSPTPDAAAVKDTLFSYNGRSEKYAQQAATYGFDPQTQPYEGSPYVMNRYDAARQSMGIITHDHGGIDGNDTRYGAFTIYSRLGGVAGGGDSCNGSISGTGIVGIAMGQLGTTGPTQSGYLKFTDGNQENWCADFVSWVMNQNHTPFTGGASGGWRIPGAGNVKSWFQAKGVWTDNTTQNRATNPPQPGDVIYYNHSHVNIVVSVSGNQAKVVGGNQGNNNFNLSSVSSHGQDLTDPDVSGWGE